MIKNRDELEWIKRVRSGDRAAFARLVYPYRRRIYSLAYQKLNHAQEAEDIVQETFLRAYIHLHRFSCRHPFSTWIYRIATNLCIDRIRKKKAEVHLDAPLGREEGGCWYHFVASREKTPEEWLIDREQQWEVRRALRALPSNYRSVMLLRYIQQMPLSEIGEKLQMPVTTVKTRVHRGRKALVRRLASSV
ncbi:RNA polymerase sigma-70 factor (ECF subfamily) [Melghirimyces profundicolus]|uniref:RNA polymerase sigma factor n=1 Tax=Melghirimyces profundicolus TaxID=1242148 RepID=A0A2T6BS72_9BACL|nr:RNA polymerase sigma factor SigW [Melghirimyces profundicolus]PTX58928.1 RNA polymerase sigma-70 factor (ECF subfamily) [Melghirimyces profundicolus]